MEKWKDFFQTYRVIEINNDNDLLYQVGTTVGGKPITLEQHNEIIFSILNALEINKTDNVLDLCCGNGIITYDVATKVNTIVGIDSSIAYIENAKKFKINDNVKYFNADILNIKDLVIREKINKVIFYSSLAYFSKKELTDLLSMFKNTEIIRLFIGSILDKNRKFLFFNTFKRRVHYLYKYLILNNDLGLGRWWSKKEIQKIAYRTGYNVEFRAQNPILHTAHYRYDCILSKKI
jgi:SAM-dependent methyltransferase